MRRVSFNMSSWSFRRTAAPALRSLEECRASNDLQLFPQYCCMTALVTEQEANRFLFSENIPLVVKDDKGNTMFIENKKYVANKLGIDLFLPNLWKRFVEELRDWQFHCQNLTFYVLVMEDK